MKYLKYIFLASSVFIVSCSKWLDIIPEDTTTEKQLFADFGGYHSAINGLYQTLSSSNLYGENLTWGYVSALSQYYDSSNSSNTMRFSYTEKYDYASNEVKAFGEQIWSTGYNVIANCNNLLQHLAVADPTIFPYYETGEMDIIKGEALAIRALVHFDILRLFAQAPAVSPDAPAIPYSTSYPELFPKRHTVSQVLTNVIADLKEAAELMAPIDSLGGNLSKMMYNAANRYMVSNSGQGFFFSARGARMNFVSIKSLLARVYAYSGDMEKAYEHAASVLEDFYDKNGSKWYMYTGFGSSTTSEAFIPHKMIDELVISFYNENLLNDYTDSGAMGSNPSSNPYKLKNIGNIFNDSDDYRQTKLITALGASDKCSIKYRERSGNSSKVENYLLPVMRISELHLIAAEYLLSENRISEAVNILNELRISRGCIIRVLDEGASVGDLNNEIEKEYWRENIAEGQYFFFCKRKNLPTINNNGVHIPMEGRYTMLIPDSETSLN